MNLYPSYTMLFVLFNLAGWWFKGKPFFSWWWIALVEVLNISIEMVAIQLSKKVINKG